MGIKSRCLQRTNRGYKNYGGRGIRVCDRWIESFAAFLEDVGPKPGPKYSIDRIDNDGNYEPGNVRWATRIQQARNTRRNRMVTHDGKTLSLTEWAEIYGIPYHRLHSRVVKRGWPLDKAVHQVTSVQSAHRVRVDGGVLTPRTSRRTNMEIYGENKPIWKWAKQLGVSRDQLREWLDEGACIEDALETQLEEQMSATNRGAEREPHDQYNTPAWSIERFLEDGPELPGGVWYEPCAGTGAIVDAVDKRRDDVRWQLADIEEEACKTLRTKYPNTELLWGTALGQTPWDVQPDVVITNPPYLPAYELLNHFLQTFPNAHIVLLLRVNFLASEARHALMSEYAPDIYVLPNRPSFKGAGKTDATEYAWFVWNPSPRRREVGKLRMLGLTSLPERRAAMV